MIDLATEELLGKRKNLSRFVTAECFHPGVQPAGASHADRSEFRLDSR
jgi:hypothetical protein